MVQISKKGIIYFFLFVVTHTQYMHYNTSEKVFQTLANTIMVSQKNL